MRVASLRFLFVFTIILSLNCGLIEGAAPSSSSAELELYGTFHAMGVIVHLAGGDDPDEDASISLEYRTAGEPFRVGFPPSRITRERFVGSLFWLEPGTEYDVRVTFNDPDGGGLDGVSLTASAMTREEVVLPRAEQSYYVVPEGLGEDCSQENPCALDESLNKAGPGDEVLLGGGVYYQGDLSLPRSGAPETPIVIRSAPGETAILDGSDPQDFEWENRGSGIYRTEINEPNPSLVLADEERLFPYKNLSDLENLTWDLPGFYADGKTLYVHLENNANPNEASMAVSRYDQGFYVSVDHLVFQDLTFRYYGRATYAKAIFFDDASDNLVQGSTFVHNNQGINIKNDSHRNLIQDNQFSDSLFHWSWEALKQDAQFVEAGGVYVNEPSTGRGNVIRRNTFHDMFDGFHACPDQTAGQTNETDIYENTIYHMGDDGMETDGKCSNVRIWGNTIHDVLVGISLSPVYTGPVYAIRNIIYNTGAGNNPHDGSPFKFIYSLSSDGPVYLFHNSAETHLPDNDGIRIGGDAGVWKSVMSRNNVWAGTRYALANFSSRQELDFDYDALYTSHPERFGLWEGLDYTSLTSLEELRSKTGQELNGLNVEPGFVDPANGDYKLNPASQLIDAGVVIPGINDVGVNAYQGSAPDIGAIEFMQFNLYLPAIQRS